MSVIRVIPPSVSIDLITATPGAAAVTMPLLLTAAISGSRLMNVTPVLGSSSPR